MPFLTSSLPALTIILLIAVLVLFILVVRLSAWKRSVETKWLNLMEGVEGENLQEMLTRHLEDRRDTADNIERIKDRLDRLDFRIAAAKRFLGFVRYDAFPEVTGQQSFSLAIFDDHGDGVVLTSQVGRSDARVFSKKLEHGEPDRTLTHEEKMAIETASRSINLKGNSS